MLGGARHVLPTLARGGGSAIRCRRVAYHELAAASGYLRRSHGSLTRSALASASRRQFSTLLTHAQPLSRQVLQCLVRGARNVLRNQCGNIKSCDKTILLRSLAGPAALLLPAKKHVDDRVEDVPLQLVDVHGVLREEWKGFDYLQQTRWTLSSATYSLFLTTSPLIILHPCRHHYTMLTPPPFLSLLAPPPSILTYSILNNTITTL